MQLGLIATAVVGSTGLLLLACSSGATGPSKAPSSASASSTVPSAEAVIVLDDAHNDPAGRSAYRIQPAANLRLETRGYEIPIPPALRPNGPSAVLVLDRKEGIFRAPWDGRGSLVLSSARLESLDGSSDVFKGFQAGSTYPIAIGRQRADGSGKDTFDVMWATIVEVVEK